ncbi:MAG: hypothetical protein K9K79_12870, partial [Desulfohalobiaceae bacterium]|nr:hypothetical protein [Desulfohalobiaceae bacterium]
DRVLADTAHVTLLPAVEGGEVQTADKSPCTIPGPATDGQLVSNKAANAEGVETLSVSTP